MFNSLATSPDSLTQIYTGFQALSDPLRLQILQLLRHQELCVCELRDQYVAIFNTSHKKGVELHDADGWARDVWTRHD